MSSDAISFNIELKTPFDEAINATTDALKSEGFGILSRIDVHQAFKEKIEVDFRPYAILGACNPQLAHAALSNRGDVGLMLPCNVIVESRSPTSTLVRIGNPDAFLKLGDFAEDPAIGRVATEARDRLRRVAEALRASESAAPAAPS